MKINSLFKALAVMLAIGAMQVHAQEVRGLFVAPSGVSFATESQDQRITPAASKSISKSVSIAKKSKFTGLAYSLFQEAPNHKLKKVSPKKVFHTGDRIKLVVTSNKDGVLTSMTIDPKGVVEVVEEQRIVAGYEYSIPKTGFLRFNEETGNEKIVFTLSANGLNAKSEEVKRNISVCATAKTRGLVMDNSSGAEFSVMDDDGSCAFKDVGTRGLVVERYKEDSYGVIPEEQIQSGSILSLLISLRHQ